MPKTTKKSSKNTTANGSFLSKLVPRSSKAKLIVFLVAFTLIGGGYMAYRSYAAETTYSFLLSQGLASNPPFEVKKVGTVSVVKETAGQKKDVNVVKVTGSTAGWSHVGALKRAEDQVPTDDKPAYFRPGKSYRVCAMVKAEGSDARFILRMIHENARGGDPFESGGGQAARTDQYVNICETTPTTGYWTWPTIIVGRGSVRVSTLSVTPLDGTSNKFTALVDNNGLKGRDGGTVTTETAGLKKGLKVIRVNDQLNAAATLSDNETIRQSFRAYLEQQNGREVRLCAYVRPNKSLSAQMSGPAQSGWEFIPVKPSGTTSNSYEYICTKYAFLPSVNERGYSVPEIRIGGPVAGDSMYVYGLVVEAR